jgi:hypothetical protein
MAFPDEQAFREWAESPDYQRISEDRHAGADTVVLLVQACRGRARSDGSAGARVVSVPGLDRRVGGRRRCPVVRRRL